ncbi:MAG: inverse autotransporter beta domain-containing protein, partial [Zetaproteobacteria bacterium]|nr:inverse autotransporter beta domain-containing protein [Zetaproteobacteria bacterium]
MLLTTHIVAVSIAPHISFSQKNAVAISREIKMPTRSARSIHASSGTSSFKPAKSGNNFSSLNTRPSMVALAVAASMLPAGVHAEWKSNIELFYTYSAETGSSSDRQFGGAQALIPFRQDANSMTFVDLRANIGEHGTNEQNIGIGHRWFNASREWIFGGYGFFDSRESINNNRFNQVSIGAEALSVVWDVRANYYHPIDDEEKIGTAPVFRFQGNRVFSNGIVEEPLEGFDVEVGHLIPGIPWETRAFVGGYTFDGDFNKDNVDGYRLRLETRPRKNIILGLAYQDDNTFDGQTFATVKYSFGYDSTAAHRTLDERMVQLPV